MPMIRVRIISTNCNHAPKFHIRVGKPSSLRYSEGKKFTRFSLSGQPSCPVNGRSERRITKPTSRVGRRRSCMRRERRYGPTRPCSQPVPKYSELPKKAVIGGRLDQPKGATSRPYCAKQKRTQEKRIGPVNSDHRAFTFAVDLDVERREMSSIANLSILQSLSAIPGTSPQDGMCAAFALST
jgi:hypothetical protein